MSREFGARGEQPGTGGQVGLAHDLPEFFRHLARPDQHRIRGGQPLAGVAAESPDVRPDGVFQCRTVHPDRVRHPAGQRAGQDRRPHHQVVGQRIVRPGQADHVPDRRRVGRHVIGDLGLRQLREQPGLVAREIPGHVYRQQAANIRHIGRAVGWPANPFDAQPPIVPAADRVHEIEFGRIPFLAEQLDIVPLADQALGQLGDVCIAA